MPKKQSKDQIIAELRAEIETLKSIIHLMPGNVYWKDNKDHYLGCNNNIAKMIKLKSPEEIVGRSTLDAVGPELFKTIKKIDDEVIKNKKEIRLEEVGFNDKNEPAIYLTRKTPLFDNKGNVKGLLGVSFDITDRKQAEKKLRLAKQKAEAANRAKSQFLSLVTHELRTPLTCILGFANFLEKEQLTPEIKKEYIQHITNSGSYLLSLINNILDSSRLDSKNFELTLVPLNLKKLMENIINMLTGSAKLKNINLYLEYETNVPEYVVSNDNALRQIFINLIGNAIKFTEKGHVAVKIKCLEYTKDSAELQIIVEDTGIGIPAYELKSIFKQFYQSGNIYTRGKSLVGTGLGLTIVKKLAQEMGGKIEVASIPQKGSIFSFTARFNTAIMDAPWLPYAESVRILVIQDSLNREHIQKALANSTYEITSSIEASNLLFSTQKTNQPFDIVIIDNNLKNIIPTDLLQIIKRQKNFRQPLPILITSNPDLAIENESFFNIFIKPGDLEFFTFQEKLKLTWEKWQQQFKKPVIKADSSKSLNILLIEDDTLIQIIHKKMLEELGCRVEIAESTNQALTMIQQNYDIMFVDIGLPDINGFELIKKIRQQLNQHTPIIALTGFSEEEERQLCLDAGADEVATKPISNAELRKVLNRYVM